MKIETDDQLDIAIARVDEILKVNDSFDRMSMEEAKELNELSDAIEEYEDRTDILNRDYKI